MGFLVQYSGSSRCRFTYPRKKCFQFSTNCQKFEMLMLCKTFVAFWRPTAGRCILRRLQTYLFAIRKNTTTTILRGKIWPKAPAVHSVASPNFGAENIRHPNSAKKMFSFTPRRNSIHLPFQLFVTMAVKLRTDGCTFKILDLSNNVNNVLKHRREGRSNSGRGSRAAAPRTHKNCDNKNFA